MSTFRWVVSGLLTVLSLGLIALIGIVFRKLQHIETRLQDKDDQDKRLYKSLGRIEGVLGIKDRQQET